MPPNSDLEGLSIDGVRQAQDDGVYLGGRNRSLPNLPKQNAEGNLSARGWTHVGTVLNYWMLTIRKKEREEGVGSAAATTTDAVIIIYMKKVTCWNRQVSRIDVCSKATLILRVYVSVLLLYCCSCWCLSLNAN